MLWSATRIQASCRTRDSYSAVIVNSGHALRSDNASLGQIFRLNTYDLAAIDTWFHLPEIKTKAPTGSLPVTFTRLTSAALRYSYWL